MKDKSLTWLRDILEKLIRKNCRQTNQKPLYSYYDIDQTVKEIHSHYKRRRLSEEEIKRILATKIPLVLDGREDLRDTLARAIYKKQEEKDEGTN